MVVGSQIRLSTSKLIDDIFNTNLKSDIASKIRKENKLKNLSRRKFLKLSSSTVILSSFVSRLFANKEEISIKTYTYKRVGDLEIKVDVHRFNDKVIRPGLVRIHGGALIMGIREMGMETYDRFLKAGYAIVNIDYRLAPETKLPDIIEDIEDVFVWLHKYGEKLLGVDTSKIAVIGDSAGGFLTLTSGFRVKPKPAVLVVLWGYGDLIGDWYSTPSKHHPSNITEQEAWQLVNGPAISNSAGKGDRPAFYRYCRKHGIWPEVVSGWDPHTEAEKFSPYMPILNVTPDFPPTILLHGTNDTDVPYEQSVMMAEEFKKHNVKYELITVPGAEHVLRGGDPETVDAAYNRALEFINNYLK